MKWTTEKRKINDLVPYEHNPRQITEKQYKDLEASLKKFDLVEIPAINKDNTIIAGHQRLNVLKLLGRGDEEIDVRVPDKQLSEKELQEYNIRSNKNTAEWDWDKMANNFEIDDLLEWGFDEKELKIEREVEEDEVPEVSDEPAVSQLGEVYQLGRHRLMCGDSTKIEDVEKLMNGQKADMVFTDPPYNADYEGRGDNNLGKIKNDSMSNDDFEKFINDFLPNLIVFTKSGGAFYVCCNWKDSYPRFYFALQKNGINVSANIVWNKGSGGMGWQDYRYQYEFIVYGFKSDGSHSWYGDRTQTDIWNFNRDGRQTYNHPTQKPVELSTKAIKNSSKTDDIVLDLFGGSGSTLIACEQTNRTCYIMELDPKYCDVIRKRYAKFIDKEDKWQEITPIV